jgi:hypothetical protein
MVRNSWSAGNPLFPIIGNVFRPSLWVAHEEVRQEVAGQWLQLCCGREEA